MPDGNFEGRQRKTKKAKQVPKKLQKPFCRERQGNLCYWSGQPLPDDDKLIDIDHLRQRCDGGDDSADNIVAVLPRIHNQRHGNYERTEMRELRDYMKFREIHMQTQFAANNKLSAVKRGMDTVPEEEVQRFIDVIDAAGKNADYYTKKIKSLVKELAKTDSHIRAALRLPGTAELTVASMLCYVDIYKARHASSLWKFFGLHCAAHERKKKGKKGGGHAAGRRDLYRWCESQIKSRSPYRDIYDAEKERLQQSQQTTLTRKRNEHGVHELQWCEVSDGHRHGAAMRKMSKTFIADWWYTRRQYLGLPTDRKLYVSSHLGHAKGLIDPEAHGWGEWMASA